MKKKSKPQKLNITNFLQNTEKISLKNKFLKINWKNYKMKLNNKKKGLLEKIRFLKNYMKEKANKIQKKVIQ